MSCSVHMSYSKIEGLNQQSPLSKLMTQSRWPYKNYTPKCSQPPPPHKSDYLVYRLANNTITYTILCRVLSSNPI